VPIRHIQAHSCKHCCSAKAISITYSEFVFVALVIRACAILSSAARLALQYFSTLTHNTIFEIKLLNVQCMPWFSLHLSSETFAILRRTEGNVIKNVYWSPCKVNVISCQIVVNLQSSQKLTEEYSNIKHHENRFSRAELFHVDGQTDRHDEADRLF